MIRRDRRSASRGVLVAAGLLLTLGSCQRVGIQEAPGPPAPTRTGPAPGAVDRPSPIGPVTRPFGEIPEAEIDPILHSWAAADATFQEQTAFWIQFWTTQQSDTFSRYLERMGQYVTLVDEELHRRGLPPSLRYLPIVESGYLPGAVSRVGATGLWQIMAPTGQGLGLTVGAIVDDRRDPVGSTYAALDYLEELHGQFDSWFLALAAYNAGPGRVGGLLDRYGGEGTGDARFLEIRSQLPAETREFVPRFFAAAALAMDPVAYGFSPVEPRPLAYDEVVVPDATSLDVVARAAGVSEEEIVRLNPHFLRGFTPAGEVRTVRVPPGRATRFEQAYALIPPSERISFVEHVVASGETFSHIARRYGVSVAEITATNGQIDPRRLQIGMRVIVPVGSSGGGGGAVQLAARGTEGDDVHVVARGESLWTIARRYGTTPEALAGANGRSAGGVLRVGEELRLP